MHGVVIKVPGIMTDAKPCQIRVSAAALTTFAPLY